MKNGEVKHSKDLVEADRAGERKMEEAFEKLGITFKSRPLAELKQRTGYYINFKGSLKGPFDTAEQATEAHKEWMWESKHG